jgi:hypothetical protein
VRRGDIIHLGLMLAALGVAYVIPFELLLLAYAVLGPAHYFTEISWLHDRNYYLPHKGLGMVLGLVALGVMFLASPYWYGVVVWAAFAGCAVLAAKTTRLRLIIGGASAGLTVLFAALHAPFAIMAALLPTLIHVCLFTLVFMVLGAVRARSGAQFGLVVAYLVAIALIIAVPPRAGWMIPAVAQHNDWGFGDVSDALGQVLGQPGLSLDARLMGLLSFVYAYHYLNWFIKAEVIHWNRMPRTRLAAIALLSAAATGFYFLNFTLGFTVLLLISLAHVLLEFPLNSLSLRELGGYLVRPPSAWATATPSPAPRAPAPRAPAPKARAPHPAPAARKPAARRSRR